MIIALPVGEAPFFNLKISGENRGYLFKLEARQKLVVQGPIFFVPGVADDDLVQLATPGKIIGIKGVGLWAAIMAEMDGGGPGDLQVVGSPA